MSLKANWNFPTHIKIGSGRLKEIGQCCSDLNIFNPLIVTDKNLGVNEITLNLTDELNSLNLSHSVFSQVDSNPTEKNLIQGLEVLKKGGFDGIIAFGGGSALDLGKLMAFMIAQDLPVWEFEDSSDNWKKATTKGILPIIAIPTTAGTGSEVGRSGVLTDSVNKIKKVIFHPEILPKSVICDPNLCLKLPQKLTAGTGMDAFAHCLEAYCSPGYHPMADGIALIGMKLVKDSLLEAYKNGENIEARTNMLSAALMGATAFQKGLGAIHALSHPIGAIYNTHHGTTNAVVMKKVLNFNKDYIHDKIQKLSIYLDIKNGFNGFTDFVDDLCNDLNIPVCLKDIGVEENQIELIASMAIVDPTASGNPRELTFNNTLNLLKDCL
jgi:alcohol dehydrogenase class IV